MILLLYKRWDAFISKRIPQVHGMTQNRVVLENYVLQAFNRQSIQPVLHNWCSKWYVLSCLWGGVYKRSLAASQKE